MNIFSRIGKWFDRLEEEHNRRVATEKYEREQRARQEIIENARRARLESERIEKEQKEFARDVRENSSKWHEYLKNSNEQIKNLKVDIRLLHEEKSALYDQKQSLHREIDDLKSSRSASISLSQSDADDSFFWQSGTSHKRFQRNHSDKERHGERAQFTKGEMDHVWSKINSIKYDIVEVKGSIAAYKKEIGEIMDQRNRVKEILFKK
jgi:chromosome segregation ATPase